MQVMMKSLFFGLMATTILSACASHEVHTKAESSKEASITSAKSLDGTPASALEELDAKMRENGRAAIETCGKDAVLSVTIHGFKCK